MENSANKRPSGFSIDHILLPSPPKRARRFFIEQLLSDDQPVEQQGEGTIQKSPDDFINVLSNEVNHNAKFKCVQSKSSFSIIKVPEDAAGFVASILQQCVERAIADSRERGVIPDHLGCIISSPLLTHDIWHPVRPITEDTIPSLLERFNQISQSKKKEGVTIWGEPFTVIVTTLDCNGLPEKRKLAGGGRQKKLAPVHHRIHPQCLIKITNPDERNYCLFYAMQATLTHTIGELPRKQFFYYLHSQFGQRGKLQHESLQLMQCVHAPPFKHEYDARFWTPRIIDHWNNNVYPGKFRFKVFIFGAMGHYEPRFKYGPDDFDTPIILYFDAETAHFHGVQKAGNLFGKPYCFSCEMPFDRESRHKKSCKALCKKCLRIGPKFPCKMLQGYHKKCTECKKNFFNDACYQYHLKIKLCTKHRECEKCGINYDVGVNTRDGREGHNCLDRYCPNCETWHDPLRGCFIKPIEPSITKEKKRWRLVAFDMETMQHTPADDGPSNKGRRVHEPNFIAAKVACAECIKSGAWKKSLRGEHCAVCGPNRTITFSHQPFNKTDVDKQVVTRHPLVKFVKWILYALPKEFDTVAYSHFGGRFDMILTFRELFIEGFNPQLIRKGNRLYTMNVKRQKNKKNSNVEFRDSWNLIPTPLAGMVPMFDLDVEDKPFFPHMANKPSNYGCLVFPTKDDYLAGGMMPQKRKEFDRWYQTHRYEPFLLDEALASYCTNDVEILMAGLVAFRGEFLEMTKRTAGPDGKADRSCYQTPHQGIDPVRDCVTISSACMRHFRANHLKPGHLAIVPEQGYDSVGANQSELAFKFLDWYEWKHGVKIQTALSEEGEKQVGKYQLDGWIEESQKGLEVHGCRWHACPKCYPDDSFTFNHGMTAGRIRERNKQRMDYILTQVPQVDIYWECEIERMKRKDREMRKRFEQYDPDDRGPLKIRDCFMGGRTGAWKLFHKAGPDEEISYYDFKSLYPYINYTTDYPVGHPKLHVLYDQVDWRKPKDNPYPLALLKVFVVPPRKIDVPVLPVRVKQRLCFPTCMACCNAYPEGEVMLDYRCEHSDQERGWVSSCTSLELEAALEEGYRVTQVLRVLEYEKSDDTLFRKYIREFYREKIQSSGFDETVRGNVELEEQFIRECEEMFEIIIDRSKMMSNKGRRALAKLCLNNLWGRFSLRNFGLSQTLITEDPCVLRAHLNNGKIEVTAVDMLTPENVLISYETKNEFVEEHPCSNVVISLFTTSAARIQLLRAMQKVARSPGCKLLYTDTDSLIFVHPKGGNPLHLGPHLGQFTDEYPSHNIVEFCSGGSKQYGLKLERKDGIGDGFYEYLLKVRGITLNHDVTVNQGLRYELFKEIVLKFGRTGKVEHIPVIYPNFLFPSILKGSIFSAPLKKIYRPYVGNGVVCARTLCVLPFGYI